MHVLLTGATGLIGGSVLERLIARGDSVRALVVPGTRTQLRHPDRVVVFDGDLADTEILTEAARGVEVVYHVAGLIAGSSRDDLVEVNVRGTENVLTATAEAGVRRVVYLSSVSVYTPSPWPFMWPITEDTPCKAHGNEDLHNYGQSKIDAEELVLRCHEAHGVEYVILRPPTVYGPGARFVEKLLQQIVDHPRMVHSYGAQFGAMQWVYVTDLAEAIVAAGSRPQAAGEVFNVAGDEIITLRRLAGEMWQIRSGRPPSARRRPQTSTWGTYRLRFDISKAQQLLGYTPQVILREGLTAMLSTMDLPRFGTPHFGTPRFGTRWENARPADIPPAWWPLPFARQTHATPWTSY